MILQVEMWFQTASGNLTICYIVPSGKHTKKLLKMAIEIVSFPMKNGGSFHSYVKLPEGSR